MILYIDGDILVYKVACAVDHENHAEHFYRYNLDNMIKNILSKTNATGHRIFLTGKDNFRYELATIIPYKISRRGKPKPAYYQECRDYLVSAWGAEIIDGMEADDAMGIAMNDPIEGCIASIDKDLKQIKGWHCDLNGDNLRCISETEADNYYWQQVLTGDSTDDIPGLRGIGEAKAQAILVEGADYTGWFNLVAAYYASMQYFEDEIPKLNLKHDIVFTGAWPDAFVEINALVYILRSQDDLYAINRQVAIRKAPPHDEN